MTTLAEIEVAANKLSNEELVQLEGRLAVMVEERGLDDAEKTTHLSENDRAIFLAAIDNASAEPNAKLAAAAKGQ